MKSEAKVQIRAARPEDLPAVQALLREAELPVDGVADQFGDGYAIAEVRGRIVAAAGVEVYGSHGLLRSVVVSPEWRGHGLGEKIARDRLRWAQDQGLSSIVLLTTTAGGYFPRLGFVPVARDSVPADLRKSGEFASICPASAVVLTLALEDVCATR
jgi:amino-acid N-acetyltransferase